jgi:hypothetical protein
MIHTSTGKLKNEQANRSDQSGRGEERLLVLGDGQEGDDGLVTGSSGVPPLCERDEAVRWRLVEKGNQCGERHGTCRDEYRATAK